MNNSDDQFFSTLATSILSTSKVDLELPTLAIETSGVLSMEETVNLENKQKPLSKMDNGRNSLCHCGSGKKYKKCCRTSKVQGALYVEQIMQFPKGRVQK